MLVFDIDTWKEGKWYVARIPHLSIESQGKTEKIASEMALDALNLLLESDEIKTRAKLINMNNKLAVSFDTCEWILNFTIKRMRTEKELTIQNVARKAKDKSHTNYYRYENYKVLMDLVAFNKYSKAIEGCTPMIIISNNSTPKKKMA